MARIYGGKRFYYFENIWVRFFVGVYILTLFIAFVTPTFLTFFQPHFHINVIIFYIFDVIGIIVIFAINKILHRANNYFSGLEGEEKIQKILSELPNIYSVFADIKLPGSFGNTDFIVVGPTGIFTIEVKSHRGIIGFDGYKLTHNGKQFPEKDILEQTLREEMNLHNYLLEQFKVGISVTPILVFANRVEIHFGFQHMRNVVVVGKPFLLEFITSHPIYNYPVSRDAIEEKLKVL